MCAAVLLETTQPVDMQRACSVTCDRHREAVCKSSKLFVLPFSQRPPDCLRLVSVRQSLTCCSSWQKVVKISAFHVLHSLAEAREQHRAGPLEDVKLLIPVTESLQGLTCCSSWQKVVNTSAFTFSSRSRKRVTSTGQAPWKVWGSSWGKVSTTAPTVLAAARLTFQLVSSSSLYASSSNLQHKLCAAKQLSVPELCKPRHCWTV